jgi:hypothetical protein
MLRLEMEMESQDLTNGAQMKIEGALVLGGHQSDESCTLGYSKIRMDAAMGSAVNSPGITMMTSMMVDYHDTIGLMLKL